MGQFLKHLFTRFFRLICEGCDLTNFFLFLQSEVKDLKKQLKRVEDDMKRSQTDSSKYYTILKDIYSKVHPAVNAPTSPTPTKEIKKEEVDEINGKSEPVEDNNSVKA